MVVLVCVARSYRCYDYSGNDYGTGNYSLFLVQLATIVDLMWSKVQLLHNRASFC